MNRPQTITAGGLLTRHDALLFDAYGVLVDDEGAMPGAVELIARLEKVETPYCVLTNSASRLPETTAAHFSRLGLPIPASRIISSGLLLEPHFREHRLTGRTTVVLGPRESQEYARRAGASLVAASAGMEAEVVIIADEKGYPLLSHLDHVLSLLLRRLDAGLDVHVVVCNPDRIYPQGPGRFGFTAGTLAAMFEGILEERYGLDAPRFARLGKPYPAIYAEAVRRTGARRPVMIGDQLATDILGANRYGMASALVQTGLARGAATGLTRPDYLLTSLAPEG